MKQRNDQIGIPFRMTLSSEIFWDTNYNTIDWDKRYKWVICRVLEYGSIKDWKAMRKYYGDKKIIEAATTSRSLTIKTLHFIHHLFNIPLRKFRCYNSTLYDPIRWMY